MININTIYENCMLISADNSKEATRNHTVHHRPKTNSTFLW